MFSFFLSFPLASSIESSVWIFYFLTLAMHLLTVEDALAHPYLASLHDLSDEPVCNVPFSFDFEQEALSEEQMKELIYKEALAFNPEYQQ